MKITRIPRIKNHRVFREFAWQATLHAFDRFNVIYGWNGSGKSTLSNILRAIEKKNPIVEGEVSIEIDGTAVQASTFGTAVALPSIRVFNKAFVDENVFLTTGGPISPIFFVGKESKEKQEEVESLRKRLTDPGGLNETQRKAKNEIAKAEKALDSFCIAQGGQIRELLRSSGVNEFNSYDKGDYKQAVEAILTEGDDAIASKRLNDEQRVELKAKASATQKASLMEITLAFPDLVEASKVVDTLLRRSIVSATLTELESEAGVELWVRDGLPLHGIPRSEGSHASTLCKFCMQALPLTRVAQLEGHFSDQYTKLDGDLKAAIAMLREARKGFDLSSLPKKAEVNDHLGEKYSAVVATLQQEATSAASYVDALEKTLEEKKRSPFKVLTLESFCKDLQTSDKEKADRAAAELLGYIRAHNLECKDFEAMVVDARRTLERALVADSVKEYEEKKAAEGTARTHNGGLELEIGAASKRITALETDIIGHHKAAEQLNEELKRYLGREELKFRSEGTGYAITRAGQPAENLSEGEKTAIAFLYFLKSLHDKGFSIANDIVVIDDPVSSLDANALFCAFGYMKERTKEAGQLFILTHNFGFFRQVKNWFFWLNGGPKSHGKNAGTLKARFFMLECQDAVGERNSQIRALDSLLWEYESEYHYLFKKVFEGGLAAPGATLESYYGLPNIARRLLEAFLSFRYPNQSGLREQLDKLSCDPATRSRVIRFVHTYSHEGAAAEEHDPTVLAETPAVLREILDLMKIEDPGHYKEMTALIGVLPTEVVPPVSPVAVA